MRAVVAELAGGFDRRTSSLVKPGRGRRGTACEAVTRRCPVVASVAGVNMTRRLPVHCTVRAGVASPHAGRDCEGVRKRK